MPNKGKAAATEQTLERGILKTHLEGLLVAALCHGYG